MRAERQAQHAVVGEYMFAERHLRQRRNLLLRLFFDELGAEEGQRIVIRQAPDRPEALAAIFFKRLEAVRFGKNDESAFWKACAPRQTVDASIAVAACGDQHLGPLLAE